MRFSWRWSCWYYYIRGRKGNGGAQDSTIEESSDTTLDDESIDESQDVDENSTIEDIDNSDNDNNDDVDFEFVGGYIASEQDYNTPVYEPEFELYSNDLIPSSFQTTSEELSKYPNARNQGNYGVCWSFASLGLAEFDLINKEIVDNAVDFSELQLAYYVYNYDGSKDPIGGTAGDTAAYDKSYSTNFMNCGGDFIDAARRIMQWISPVDETKVPYSNVSTVISSGLDDGFAYSSSYAYNSANKIHLSNVYKIT